MIIMRVSAGTPPRFGTFISAGDAPAGGGCAAPIKAPDAGMKPASNALLTRPTPPTLDGGVAISDPHFVTSQLVTNLYTLLSRFEPTERTAWATVFDPVGLLDGQNIRCVVRHDRSDGSASSMIIDCHAVQISLSIPPDAKTFKTVAPRTAAFAFGVRVCGVLRQRLDTPNEDDEWLMRAEWADRRNRSERVQVRHSELRPKHHEPLARRLAELEARAHSLTPRRYIPYGEFVRLVACLVQKGNPHRRSITGNEQTWPELESHGGLYNSGFSRHFAPVGHEGQQVIDLVQAARTTGIDHANDPIRNGFRIYAESRVGDAGARLSIGEGEDDGVGENGVSRFLDLYDQAIDTGYAVEFNTLVQDAARGSNFESVYRNDKRLRNTRHQFTAETVPVSIPLPPDEPGSLPPL